MVIKYEKIMVEKTVDNRYCDICGEKGNSFYRCDACDLDMCPECYPKHGRPYEGDYPIYCFECIEALDVELKEMSELWKRREELAKIIHSRKRENPNSDGDD